jgi:hypothetical protein
MIVVLLIGLWLAAERLTLRPTVPPASVATFPAFVEWRRSPRDIEVIRQGGGEYLLATARGGGLLPSGPAGYVFDRSGRLVDWSSDIGDDPRFRDKWVPSSQRTGPHLDVTGARKWLTGGTMSG